MLPGSNPLDDIATDALDDVFLPTSTTSEQRVNKFQPKSRGKPKKPVTTASNPSDGARASESEASLQTNPAEADAGVSKAFDMEDATICVVEATGAINLRSSSYAPVHFSSHVNETEEPLNLTKGLLTHEVACQDGAQVSEAVPVLSDMESHDDILLQFGDTAAIKQGGKFQPKSDLRPKKQKDRSVSFIIPDAAEPAAVEPESVSLPKENNVKSVSFSLPDAVETAASAVGAHSEVLADNLTGAEPSFLQMMNDEILDKVPHSTSIMSDNVDVQLDHGSARNEDLADLSGLECFDSILAEPTSVTGKTMPKFRPKPSAKTKTMKSNSSGNYIGTKEATSSQWDSLSMDTEPLEDRNICITNLSDEHADPVEMSSLEAGSPGGNVVFETIDTTLDIDNYIGGKRKLSAVSEDTGNEVRSWNDEDQNQQILDDHSTSKAFEEHSAGKSSRKLRKKIPMGSSGKLDTGNSENWDVENSDSQMDEEHSDDDYRGEDMLKRRKKPKASERQMADAQKPTKRRRKASKELDSTKTEPPKKKFPHGTRRKRRQVDKVLLDTPEYELDHKQIVIRQLILLGEAKERISSKEVAALKNNQSNNGLFSNGTHFDQDNLYDDDNDPYGDEAHRDMLRNSKKVNYQTHSNKEKSGKWSKAETKLFYDAIRQFGTDFGMIEKLFPNRTRRQVKSKFKIEERTHPSELRDAMTHRSKDHSHFEKVIQLLQAQAEEEPRLDDATASPTTAKRDEEERDQPEKAEQEASEGASFEKLDEWDGDGTSDYNEYEGVEWDGGGSFPQNEEKYSEYNEFY